MKYAIPLAAMLLAFPASAAEITWKLSDLEQQQLLALLDLAAKQGGVNAAPAVSYFVNKLKTPPEVPAAPAGGSPPKK